MFAAARSAAGQSVIEVQAGTLGQALAGAVAAAPGLAEVLDRCSTLVDGVVSSDAATPVAERVDVLPPFAGG